jgi:hypothetical protein
MKIDLGMRERWVVRISVCMYAAKLGIGVIYK